MRSYYVIVYDIPANRRRNKVARLLEQIGERVQRSVFEAWLTKDERQRLLQRLANVMDEKEDSLRMYTLCAACRKEIYDMGRMPRPQPPGVRIV